MSKELVHWFVSACNVSVNEPAPVLFACHEARRCNDNEIRAHVTAELCNGEALDLLVNGREAMELVRRYDEIFNRKADHWRISEDSKERYLTSTFELGRVQSEILKTRIAELEQLKLNFRMK